MWGGRQPLHTWLVAMLVSLVNSIRVTEFPHKTGQAAYRLDRFDFKRYLSWLNQAP
jgi:hypothetical protein